MVLELYSFKASRPSFDESVVPIKPLLHAIVLKTGHTLNVIITLLNLWRDENKITGTCLLLNIMLG